MTTLSHGTTIETINNHGHVFHRVCVPGGGMCRYAETEDTAQGFASTFEELYKHR